MFHSRVVGSTRRGALALLLLWGLSWGIPASAPAAPSAPANSEFQKRLAALSTWVDKQGGQLSASALDLANHGRLGEANPRAALNPASNMKLLTAAAALDLLGPGYEFHTGLYGRLTPSEQQPSEGRVVADLVLRGNGDPSLRVHHLWRLANVLVNLGVVRVERLLVDQSRFDNEFVPPAFDQQPDEWATFRAPVSAIAVNRNQVTLNVVPGSLGKPARIWFHPPGFVETRGSIRTAERGGGQSVRLRLLPRGHTLTAKLGGHVAVGLGRQRFRKRVDNPLLLPGLVLRALLEQRNVEVGQVALGGQQIQQRITYHASPKLGVLLQHLGKRSDNFYAEMVLKALGATLPAANGGAPQGTSSKGVRALRAWLERYADLPPQIRLTNGSGLFDANRLSSELIVQVLKYTYRNSRLRHEFISQLSIGGVDGTLRARFKDLEKYRRLRAKTGTLRKAVSLSGYMLRKQGHPPIAFSFLVTGIDGRHGAIRRKIDDTVSALAKL